MSREIKFRAWDKVNKVMVLWENLCFPGLNDDGMVSLKESLEHLGEFESDKPSYYSNIMQYTGLKDRNGREIYEGDIIPIEDEWTEPITDDGRGPVEPFNHLAEVSFFDGSFGLTFRESGDFIKKSFVSIEQMKADMGDDFLNRTEVIGNRFENHELLNV